MSLKNQVSKSQKMNQNNSGDRNQKVEFTIQLVKKIWMPICIGLLSLVLFLVFLPMNSSIKKRYITPYQDSVTKQTPDLYIVSTYYANDETSVKFLQTLNQLEKKYNIPYYLVNASTYPDILDAWEIKYWPTYFVFERQEADKDAKLVYKSYGNKEVVALEKEITNVRKYGMPVSNIGGTISSKNEDGDNYLDITLVSIKSDENNTSEFVVEFYVENKTKKEIAVDYSSFIVNSNLWNKEGTNTTADNRNAGDVLKLNSGGKENVLIRYSADFPYNQIDIYYKDSNESSSKYKWTYKLWPTE